MNIQNKLVEVAKALTAEKDYRRLLRKIVTEAMAITDADGGTLYILRDGSLYHEIVENQSMKVIEDMVVQSIVLEPIEMVLDNVSAYSAINVQTVNIEDVYHSELFDFSGPKHFDNTTGYKTKSMMVCPLINRKEQLVGVLQLINSINEEGKVVSFNESNVEVIESLGSLAGIAIENAQYIEEIRGLFESFVKAIAKTIDERTPYNKLHSENLAKRVSAFSTYLDKQKTGKFKDYESDRAHLYKLVTACWLHDIGKVVVPLQVLDKSDRLAHRHKPLMDRYDLIESQIERNYYKDMAHFGFREDKELAFKERMTYMKDLRDFVTATNSFTMVVDSERREKVLSLVDQSIEGVAGVLLTEEEAIHLSIPRGTLTDYERDIVREHMPAGERILSELNYPDYLDNIFDWIMKHHEYLDGSGYPKHCTAEVIPTEARMMTMLDIFDSLVQSDRPYKKAMAPNKALEIIKVMAEDHKLDKDLTSAFEASGQWALKF